MSTVRESSWKKESGYIWSMIGSAVGFANILSFSALCYRNGGGAFLIPYLLAHLCIGIPMLVLEGTIGQQTKKPLVSAMGSILGNKGRLLGWFSVLTCATIGGFYMVLTGFSIAYSYFTATAALPADSAFFFKHIFLQDTGSLLVVGSLVKGVFFSTLLVALFTWIVLARNIQSGIEKICTLFLPILGILIFVFAIAALCLPGASMGIKHYLFPDFSRLGNWTLWRDVFGQVFFSLSLGLGIVVGYSRHNPDSFNIPRAMVKVAIGDVIISFTAGLAIFAAIGFMSVKSGMPFAEIVTSDSAFEIGFVIFPQILAQFGSFAALIGPLFFASIFIAGITGVFSIVESVVGNLEVEYQKKRKSAVAIAICLLTALALPFCMGNGQPLLGALERVLGNAMLLGGIAEIILFVLLYKVMGKTNRYSFLLKSVVLPVLLLCLCGALYQECISSVTTSDFVRYGWFVLVILASATLAHKRSKTVSVT